MLETSRTFGIDPLRMAFAVADIPRSISTALQYKTASRGGQSFPFTAGAMRLCLGDHRDNAGRPDRHYFHQDLWAARKVHERNPPVHVDVGSRIDGFIAHLLCFTSVTVIDIRPKPLDVPGLNFVQGDATELSGVANSSIASLSSLHAMEHFGLGRYGDPIDPTAPFRAMQSLARVLAEHGRLYFSVPTGRQRLEFNAHRIFAPQTVLETFSALQLVSFSAIDDDGNFLSDVNPAQLAGSEYACGLFEFTKCSTR